MQRHENDIANEDNSSQEKTSDDKNNTYGINNDDENTHKTQDMQNNT